MATGSVGSLTVVLGLDAAQYVSGLTKAEYQARQFGEKIGTAIRDGASLAVASLATISTGAIAAFATFDQLVKSAGDFQDLAEKTGASAEALASFGVAAGTAGTTVDAVAQASVRLTKNLTGVDDESKEAGAAIAALGLNLKDFKSLAPEDQITEISKALAGFQDGAQKTAVATALFGKAGADLLPFLKALEEQGGRQVILTAQQITQADEYADKQAEATAKLQQYAQAAATQALPALTAFTNVMTDAIKEMAGLGSESNALAANTGVQTFAESAIDKLALVADAAQGLTVVFSRVGEFIGASAAAAQAKLTGDVQGLEAIRKAYDESLNTSQFSSLRDKYRKALADQKAFQAESAKISGAPDQRKVLNFSGAAKKAPAGSDATKNILDNQLKAYENAAKEEQDILQSRNKMLDLYNSANLISTKDYYAGKRQALDEAVAGQIAAYDQEIAALQAYQAKAGKATDREASQGKINDLLAKKSKLQRDAAQSATEMGFAEQKANEAYKASLNELNAKVLELQGNLVGAANIRFDAQNADLLKKSLAEGNGEAVKQIAYLKEINSAQAAINKAQQDFSTQRSALQQSEESIARDQQLGIAGQIDGLVKLGAARKAALDGMQKSLSDLQALQASGTHLTDAQKQSIADLTNQVKSLSTQLDPLGEKFNTMFADSAGNAFTDFVNGTKTAKEAFNSFIADITSQLLKLAVQDVFKSLFSGGGAATGGAGFNLGSFLSSFMGKAGGGMVSPGSLHRVNENGPELFDYQGKQFLLNGNKNAKIASNDSIGAGGGFTQNLTYVVPGVIDRSTQTQLANDIRRKTNTAAQRFA